MSDLRDNLRAISEALRQLGVVGELTSDPQVSADPVWLDQAEAHLATVGETMADLQRLIMVSRDQLATVKAELRRAVRP